MQFLALFSCTTQYKRHKEHNNSQALGERREFGGYFMVVGSSGTNFITPDFISSDV